MAYLSLYRKHRPRTFEEVVGQDHVTRTLVNALSEDTLHHAYLFTGQRGTGKTSTARILAAAVNCEQGPTPHPCGECEQCTSTVAGTNVDVIELDMASHGGVDDARELRDRAVFAPAAARRKVYILDEVHMASTAAFNALLKVIEEPPSHVLFTMATTDPQKVLPTIMSRVQRLDLRRVAAGPLIDHMANLGRQEGFRLEDDAAAAVAAAGDGSVRDTLSVLDQVLAFAADGDARVDGTLVVTADHVTTVLGTTPFDLVHGIADAIADADVAGALTGIQQLLDEGHDLRRFTLDLARHMRDLLVTAAAPDVPGLVDTTDERRQRLADQATRFGSDTLVRAVERLGEVLVEQRQGPPRLPLELAVARLATPGADGDLAALADRVARLERTVAGTTGGVPGPAASRAGGRSDVAARSQSPASAITDRQVAPAATTGAGTVDATDEQAASSAASATGGGIAAAGDGAGSTDGTPDGADDGGVTGEVSGEGGSGGHVAQPSVAAPSGDPAGGAAEPAVTGGDVASDGGPDPTAGDGPVAGEAARTDVRPGGTDLAAADAGRGGDGEVDTAAVAEHHRAPDTDGAAPQDADAAPGAIPPGDDHASTASGDRAPGAADRPATAGAGTADGTGAAAAGGGSAAADGDGEDVEDLAERARRRADEAGELPPAAPLAERPGTTTVEREPTPPAPGGEQLDVIVERWEAILDLVADHSRRAKAFYEPATPVRLHNGVLLLSYPPNRRFHAEQGRGGEMTGHLARAIEQSAGLSNVRVDVRLEDDGPARPTPPPVDDHDGAPAADPEQRAAVAEATDADPTPVTADDVDRLVRTELGGQPLPDDD